jgi:hypothetical protein
VDNSDDTNNANKGGYRRYYKTSKKYEPTELGNAENSLYVCSVDGTIIKEIPAGETFILSKKGGREFDPILGTYRTTKKIKNGFVKVNDGALLELDNKDLPIIKIISHVCQQTGKIIWSNGKYIRNGTDIGKICGVGVNTGKRILKKMIEEDVIHKHKDSRGSYFTFNPFIALRGQRATIELFEDFKDSKWRWINSSE